MGKIITIPEDKRLLSDETAIDISQLGFHSDYQSLQIIRIYKSTLSLDVVAGGFASDSREIPHNLKFTPAFFSYIDASIGPLVPNLSNIYQQLGASGVFTNASVTVDNNNVTIFLSTDNPTPDNITETFTYYIFLFSIELERI